VYKPQYRVQVLHHAAVCDLDEVLFVVANEYKPIFATLISVTAEQRIMWRQLVTEFVYERSLKWAYIAFYEVGDPEIHFPDFRENAVSTPSHHVDRDVVLFHFAIWRYLLDKLHRAEMPLPTAKRIVPTVVSHWNKNKGRIDEMSGYLAHLKFNISQATPKQLLTQRELKKVALNTFLVKKHCFNSISPETFKSRSFSQIRKTVAKHEGTNVGVRAGFGVDVPFHFASTWGRTVIPFQAPAASSRWNSRRMTWACSYYFVAK